MDWIDKHQVRFFFQQRESIGMCTPKYIYFSRLKSNIQRLCAAKVTVLLTFWCDNLFLRNYAKNCVISQDKISYGP